MSRTNEMVSSGDRSRMVRLGRDVAVEERVDMNRGDARDVYVVAGTKACDGTDTEMANRRAAIEGFIAILVRFFHLYILRFR